MLGTAVYGAVPYGAATVNNRIIIIADFGDGIEYIVISNSFSVNDYGVGVDAIGGEYSKIVSDYGVGTDAMSFTIIIFVYDNGYFREGKIGGRRWRKLTNEFVKWHKKDDIQ